MYIVHANACCCAGSCSKKDRLTDGRTDRPTDGPTGRQRERERQGGQEVERQSNRLGRALGHFIFSLIIGRKRILFTNTFQRL